MSDLAPVITIDGPGGTGKGTICHLLAKALNWHVLDSGSLYRLLALSQKKNGVGVSDVKGLVNLALNLHVVFVTDPQASFQVILDGENVISQLREESIGQNASIISQIPEVREALLERQRAFRCSPGLVTDGRDMGTVVFPDAPLKIYLDASQEERAKRRYLQLQSSKINVSLAGVLSELALRDARDAERACSPMVPAKDAVIIDTTALTLEAVFEQILSLAKERGFNVS